MNKVTLLISALFTCLLFSCKEDPEKNPPAVPFAFKALFSNGDSVYIKEGTGGINSYGRGGGVIDSAGTYFEIQSTFFTGGGNRATINFMQSFSSEPDSSERESIFHNGDYLFGSSRLDSLEDGVEIILRDSSGKNWRTSLGNQDTSYFTVTEHKENDFDNNTPFLTSGNLECVLYDSLGNSLVITSGNFTGRSVVYP